MEWSLEEQQKMTFVFIVLRYGTQHNMKRKMVAWHGIVDSISISAEYPNLGSIQYTNNG